MYDVNGGKAAGLNWWSLLGDCFLYWDLRIDIVNLELREGFMGDLAWGMLSIYLSPTHQQEKPKLIFYKILKF